MESLLRLKERVDIAIEIGESYYREFKSALEGKQNEKIPRDYKEVCYDIAKTLVAFANADGGELFVGIEDDNNITGLPYLDEKNSFILKAPENNVLKETPLPLKRASIIDYNGKKIAYFSVDKGSKFVHLTSKGECFQRKDRESVPTASELIRFAREEEISREYDRQFVELASINDLDISLVESVAENTFKSMSPEKFLQYLELAEFDGDRLKLRRAALLLFAKNPTKWHPRLQVRILKVKGTEEKTGENFNVKEEGEVNDNIFRLIESSWELLRPHLTETRFSKDAIFQTQIIYPELACREALTNAITHRDYSIEGRGVEVKIFEDRLEIISPGNILSSITIKDLEELKGVHQSRNTYVARALREFGYIRELGEGIRRIFELMQSNDLVKPRLESPNKSFMVTLFYKFIYTKEEKIWLANFEDLKLSREQKTVVRLGLNGRLLSTKEIFEQVGIVSEHAFNQLIESLRNINILQDKITRKEVGNIAKKRSIPRNTIPKYQIVLPNTIAPITTKSKSENISHETPKGKRAIRIIRTEKPVESKETKVYLGNLSYSIKEEDIISLFKDYGTIISISIPRNHFTDRARGFAFVEFENEESVRKLIDEKVQISFRDRKIYIQKIKEDVMFSR